MQGSMGTVLPYLNCHTNCVGCVVFVLVGGLVPIGNLLYLAVESGWLLLAITNITAYLVISDDHAQK